MSKFRNRFLAVLGLIIFVAIVLAGCSAKSSQQSPKPSSTLDASKWPERPINVVVGFAAGGVTDLVARALAPQISKGLGVPIAVSNMPGGTGGIAAEYVFRAPKDGYTILCAPESLRILAVMGYHPTIIGKDWQPLIAASFDGVISVPANSPIKDYKELVEKARNAPNTIKLAASSPGTVWHIQSQLIAKKFNVPLQFIPYQGSHPSQTAALSGEVEVVHTGIGEQAELIRSGKLRPLTVVSDKPYELKGFGKIPPITDVLPELKDYLPMSCWVAYVLPTGVPDEIMQKIEKNYLEAVNSEEFHKFIKNLEGEVIGYNAKESLEFGKKETEKVSWLVYELGITSKSPSEFNISKP
jgi:tripartite-type tricarboxylate transporter receptor subunit TctC